MKWGVRRAAEELGQTKGLIEKSGKSDIMRLTISGHDATPKKADSNAVIDHVSQDGSVDVRSFYNESGWKARDVHTTDHGHPKQHPFGVHGEHIETYQWNDDGTLKGLSRRELSPEERKENEDIL